MKWTAKATIQIADGLYPAQLLSIEEQEPSENSPHQNPYARWTFRAHTDDAPDGVELIANSSLAFGPKSKARGWMQAALGRVIEPGEEIDPAAVCPLECQVLVKNDPESGFSRIEDVLQAKNTKPVSQEGEGVEL
jgi:hypothetical protein